MGLVHFISFIIKYVYIKFRLQNNYFIMRQTERINQNTIKIIDLHKKGITKFQETQLSHIFNFYFLLSATE